MLAFAREGYTKTSFSLSDTLGTFTYPGFWKMSLSHWKSGLDEQHRSLRKSLFLKSLQTLVPTIEMDDLSEPGAGRASASRGRQRQPASGTSPSPRRENAIHVPQRAVAGGYIVADHQPVYCGYGCGGRLWLEE